MAFAEAGQPHRTGAIQSFSYWPYPRSTRTTHERSQAKWAAAQAVEVVRTIDSRYYDTYYFHYHDVEDVMLGKPWQLANYQLLNTSRTLYIGGCASYETVEDSFQHTLQLVQQLVDDAAAVL